MTTINGLTLRHLEGSELSNHHRGSPVIDRDLHQDARTIMIFIERTKSHFVGTVGSPSDKRRRGSVITRLGPRVSYLISIRRLGRFVEERHDRGVIEQRSCSFIIEWVLQSLHWIRRRSTENQDHDRAAIVA